MKANLENLEGSRVAIDIDVDSQQLEEAINQAYKKVVKQVTVPGFRKGKAPRFILEKQYGVGIFYEDAVNYLLPKVYNEALEELDVHPVDQPDVDIKNIEAGEGATFRIEVDVYPEVDLGDYKGLEATKEVETVSEEQVNERLKSMQEQNSELIVVDSRDDVQQGDFAIIDFTGYIDGKPFPGGAAQDHSLEIGSGQFIPGFEEQLIGVKVGEEKEIEVTFPEDYNNEELAGKPVTFKVKVKDLKEKLLPELDDDFAKEVSDKDTLDELKEQIRKELEDAATHRTKTKLENTLIEKAIEVSDVSVPESMVKRQAENMMREFSTNLMYQGLSLEKYLEMANLTQEQLLEEFNPQAEQQVKGDLVLDAIAEKEGITVSDEEVTNKVDELVNDSPQPEESRKMFESRKDGLKSSMIKEKTLEFLKEQANITEVEKETEENSQ